MAIGEEDDDDGDRSIDSDDASTKGRTMDDAWSAERMMGHDLRKLCSHAR